MKKGLKLIKNSKTLYTKKLNSKAWVADVAYITHTDCYLLAYKHKIYRKDNNSEDLYLFLDVYPGSRVGACLRYSGQNGRVFVANDSDSVKMINFEACSVEKKIRILGLKNEKIFDFKVYQETETSSKVACLMKDGLIITLQFHFGPKTENHPFEIFRQKLPLSTTQTEQAYSLEVCSASKYGFIELITKDGSNYDIVSRYLIAKIQPKNLEILAEKSLLDASLPPHLALASFYVGSDLMILALSCEKKSKASLIWYDSERGVVVVDPRKRVWSGESFPVAVCESGRNFYYFTGWGGGLVRIGVKAF